MPPLVCIVGTSKSGKTSLIEKLLSEFQGRGYHVATIKHAPFGFQLDLPGKDSRRLAEAGSECVLLSSPEGLALIKKNPPAGLASLEQYLEEYDLVVAEGFRKEKAPKIETHCQGEELLCHPEELIAVITKEELKLDLPQYSPEDISGIAELIQRKVLATEKEEVKLFADGKKIPLGPFPKEVIARMIFALTSTLKGVEEPERISISVRKGKFPK